MKRTIACLLLLLVLAGCKSAGNDGELKIAAPSTVSSLDPYSENSAISFSVYSNIYEPLVTRDINLSLVPQLAVEWRNPDDLTWILTLRKGVRFHDGSELTAKDVQASLERARDPARSKISNALWMIDRVQALPTGEVKITTSTRYSSLMNRLAEVLILPAKSIAGDGSLHSRPPGTGPYIVSDWKPGAYVRLERNPDYWDASPSVRSAVFVAVQGLRDRVAGLERGEYNILPQLEPSVVDDFRMRNSKSIRLLNTPGLGVIYLGMDLQRDPAPYVDAPHNPFRDLRVRQAVYRAINIRHIVHDILEDYAEPASEMVAPMIFGFDSTITRPAYDPEAARKLLAEAGYPNGFSLRFDFSKDRYRNDLEIGRSIAADLENVGIHVQQNPLPRQSLFDTINSGKTSFYMVGWFLSSGEASSFFDYLVHTRDERRRYGRENSGGFSDPELDAMIESYAGIMKPNDRAAALRQMMQLTMQKLPYIPLHIENNFCAADSKVDWQPRPDEYIFVKDIRWK